MTGFPKQPADDGNEALSEKGLDEYLMEAWSRKWWIAGATLLFGIAGIVSALTSPQVFQSKAVIASKENPAQGGGASAMLSQLGGLGGFAAQLGIGAGQNDHLVLMLQSWEFQERVVKEHNLAQRFFPKHWNAEENRWNNPDSSKWPQVSWSVTKLSKSLDIGNDKRMNAIIIKANADNPKLAQDLVADCMATFNQFLRERALRKLKSNMSYLESQLGETMDPMLREKIQIMIAGEIEKSMLMSVSGFEVLQEAFYPLDRLKPNRQMIVIAFTLAGFVLSLAGTFLWDYLMSVRRRFRVKA